jgi:hypothetical protein
MPTANRVDGRMFLTQTRHTSVNDAVGPPSCALGTSSDAATVCAGSRLVREQRAGVVGMRSCLGDGGMLALGSCIAGSGFLFGALLALLVRHPNPPRWTRPEIVAMLICLPLTGVISIGLAFTVVGLWQLVNGTGSPLELVVLAAVVIGLVLAWRGFGIGQRLKSYAPATGGFPTGA